jgi:hypothetical protein
MATMPMFSSPYDFLTDEEASQILAGDPNLELSEWYFDDSLSDDQLRVMQIVDGRLASRVSIYCQSPLCSDDSARKRSYRLGRLQAIEQEIADDLLWEFVENEEDYPPSIAEKIELAEEELSALKQAARRHFVMTLHVDYQTQLAIDSVLGKCDVLNDLLHDCKVMVDEIEQSSKQSEIVEIKTIADPASLIGRAIAYASKFEPATEGSRNNSAYSKAGNLFAMVDELGRRLSDSEVVQLMFEWNRLNNPPLPAKELFRTVISSKTTGTPRDIKPPKTELSNNE